MSDGVQASKRIEQLAPELDKILSPSEPIQELADGFGGPLGPAEGPVWWKEGRYLLFSDIHNNRSCSKIPAMSRAACSTRITSMPSGVGR